MGYDRDAYQKNKADALFRMGFHSEVTGRTDEAVRKYESALQAFPAHYESHVQLSRIFRRKGVETKAAFHEEMAHRSKLKLPLDTKRPPPEDERPPSAPVREVKRSVEAGKEDIIDPEGDTQVKAMLPLVWDAFFGRFDHLREIQRRAVPVILGGDNALIISSTAGGKTEAVFAPLVERLVEEGWTGTSIIYISPTKALASDIRGRMEGMLNPLGIRAALRSGDIKELDRNNPQDVLVTTPESLDSLIAHMPEMVKDVRAVVLDELHMVDGTYRGDQLRILLRRLASIAPSPIAVYAASATVSDPHGLASRYMPSPKIVTSPGGRGIDYRIAPSLEHAARVFRERGLRKCLIFCNTPEEVETLANGDMRRWFPPHVIKVHHGKLQVPKRVEAERALRSDERTVCVCTSTLEVGVDIGDIDMVILANRPRSIASIAQRIGRANRREKRISAIAVARSAGEAAYYDKVFEAIVRSKYACEEHSFDPSVVVQQIFSTLSGPPGRSAAEVQGLFRGIMTSEDVADVWSHLRDGGWIEQLENGTWTIAKRAREMGAKIYSNIPGSESIEVVEMETDLPIGDIALPIDNIFILGGQAWLVRKRLSNRVMVSKVDSGTDIANFASYDRFGAFFDLLPVDLRMRHKKTLGNT
ncbi:MAG: DEAD/DEAH box helicase [Methanomassiliicoccus sp.]|nr:DEAD/DEAH box helicase [Methanomassiliicoccus sp.]